MKTKFLTLALLAALAACNRAPANNVATGNASAAAVNTAAPAPAPAPAAAPGQTAMPAGLDCVRNRLSPDQRRAVAELAMEQGSRDDPRAQPLYGAGGAITIVSTSLALHVRGHTTVRAFSTSARR